MSSGLSKFVDWRQGHYTGEKRKGLLNVVGLQEIDICTANSLVSNRNSTTKITLEPLKLTDSKFISLCCVTFCNAVWDDSGGSSAPKSLVPDQCRSKDVEANLSLRLAGSLGSSTILTSEFNHFTNKNLTLLPRNHRLVGISPTRSSLTRGLTASHPLSIRPREYVCDPSQLRGVVPEDTRGRFQSSFQMPIPS
jgi:hypothetical protein